MKRMVSTPRLNWQKIVEEQGLVYHSPNGKRYWDESAYYTFSMTEIDALERATEDLYQLYLVAAQHVIDTDRFEELGISSTIIPYIIKAWNDEPPSLYGRFDLAYDGTQIKLLEFNADTPTSLVEAAIIQWYWKQDVHPSADQFNSIHEKLVDKWRDIGSYLGTYYNGQIVYFCHLDDWEDWMTVAYLRDTAAEAKINTAGLLLSELGWNYQDATLRDLNDNKIDSLFKLYPWEWLIKEIPKNLEALFFKTQWIEPVWKMLWSNKAMLSILWELNPGHPLLLETHIGNPKQLSKYAKKPIYSREGANVTLVGLSSEVSSPGPYGEEGFVYQQLFEIPPFQNNYPVLGSWYITDQGPAGMGIRESNSPITNNVSRFVPHIIE